MRVSTRGTLTYAALALLAYSTWVVLVVQRFDLSARNSTAISPLTQQLPSRFLDPAQIDPLPSAPLTSIESNLSTSSLPIWFNEYIDWHTAALSTMNESNWKEQNFLVVVCLKGNTCGGTADRLKPTLLAVKIAAELRRLVFFYWERPCSLDQFLSPTRIDWRMPLYMQPEATKATKITTSNHIRKIFNTSFTPEKIAGKQLPKHLPRVLTMAYQSHDHGADLYNEYRDTGELDYNTVFGEFWHALFRPSIGVQGKINTVMTQLNLEPGQYVASHIRSQYRYQFGPLRLQELAKNAMNCASRYRIYGEPIYVATDNATVTETAIRYVVDQRRGVAKAMPVSNNKAVLHLDRGDAFLSRNASEWTAARFQPSDYYDTFVDLYILSLARCISYHTGNYGKWANLMSSNITCASSHAKKQCRWKRL